MAERDEPIFVPIQHGPELQDGWSRVDIEGAFPFPLPTISPDSEHQSPSEHGKDKEDISVLPMWSPRSLLSKLRADSPRTSLVGYPFRGAARSVGKLIMKFPRSPHNSAASGWVLARRGIGTAAHCLYDAALGGWAKDAWFYPQLYDGATTLGGWKVSGVWLYPWWTERANWLWDFAVGVLEAPIPVRDVPPLRVLRHTSTDWWDALGYPGEPIPGYAFNGRRMWASHGRDKSTAFLPGSYRMENILTGGSSGGPWITYTAMGMIPLVGGLNSRSDTHGRMYSPWLGRSFGQLVDRVIRL
jgi:hypothetical protein